MPSPPIGRLAPSPTGYLHVGHARSFLLAYWHAVSRGGKVVFRIDDLDGVRCRSEYIDAALRDCEWLGLEWEGAPLIQSERLDALREAALALHARGLAYPCVCSRAEIRALSAPHADEPEVRYPGTCRSRFESLDTAHERTGRAASLRFRVPQGTVTVADGFTPPLVCDVSKQAGDFVVLRRDRAPAYQLAVVLDDYHQGVTEIVRGDDLLASTARQKLLQNALGLPQPMTFHMPLVLDERGNRLAKRHEAIALTGLRAAGVDPRAIVGWAAQSAGLELPDRVTAKEVLRAFRLNQVPKQPVVWTAQIEDWMFSQKS